MVNYPAGRSIDLPFALDVVWTRVGKYVQSTGDETAIGLWSLLTKRIMARDLKNTTVAPPRRRADGAIAATGAVTDLVFNFVRDNSGLYTIGEIHKLNPGGKRNSIYNAIYRLQSHKVVDKDGNGKWFLTELGHKGPPTLERASTMTTIKAFVAANPGSYCTREIIELHPKFKQNTIESALTRLKARNELDRTPEDAGAKWFIVNGH